MRYKKGLKHKSYSNIGRWLKRVFCKKVVRGNRKRINNVDIEIQKYIDNRNNYIGML